MKVFHLNIFFWVCFSEKSSLPAALLRGAVCRAAREHRAHRQPSSVRAVQVEHIMLTLGLKALGCQPS